MVCQNNDQIDRSRTKRNISQMKWIVSLFVLHQIGSLHAIKVSEMTLSHPDKNGYQSLVAGSDKHKFGYELKENKQFHHTTTEKDGVRLGCYGYELNGKKYSTQYVADSRGYRIVTNQDLISVYPKSGGLRKASFVQEFDEDPALSSNIRYFFPDGCKGVDVLIDNSSRLRSLASSVSEVNVRLPVTLKPTTPYPGYSISHPNSLNPPGPPFIYPEAVLNLVKVPMNHYMATTKSPSLHLKPQIPVNPSNLYLPVEQQKPSGSPASVYLPSKQETPANAYLPTNFAKPPTLTSNVILPPKQKENDCESLQGKLVISIPLKGREGEGCCAQVAKLIFPIGNLDSYSINRLKTATPDEIDASQLIKNILENLL